MQVTQQTEAKRQRARELQRQRRAKKRRIDYYPSEAAAAVIDALADQCDGKGFGGVIDRLILRLGAQYTRRVPESGATE